MAEAMDTTNVGTQPQIDPGDIVPRDLIIKHVLIVLGKSEQIRGWVKGLKDALESYNFKVGYSQDPGDEAVPLCELESQVAQSQKVIMVIDRDYLSSVHYKKTLEFVEHHTAIRHREILVPVLYKLEYDDLPSELHTGNAVPVIGLNCHYPKLSEQNWEPIVKAITNDVHVLSTVTKCVAYGLAWGYYFGYLHVILPEFSERFRTQCLRDVADWTCDKDAKVFPKMIILVPNSVLLLQSLSQYDPEIEVVTSRSSGDPIKVKHSIDFPGHPRKDYSSTVFKIKVDGKDYLFFAEVPTTLNTLAHMRDTNWVQHTSADHEKEIIRFRSCLEAILITHEDQHSDKRKQSIKILPFTVDPAKKLSKRIADEILKVNSSEVTPWKPLSQ